MTPLPLIEEPQHLPLGFRLLKSFENETWAKIDSFYVVGSYLVVQMHPPCRNQLVLPLAAVHAIYDHLDSCLRPKPETDDFPWSWRQDFDGEEIGINRGMSLGGDDIAGYRVSNFSRGSYISPILPQAHSFLDTALLDGGQLDFLGEVARRYEAGEFQER